MVCVVPPNSHQGRPEERAPQGRVRARPPQACAEGGAGAGSQPHRHVVRRCLVAAGSSDAGSFHRWTE